MDLGISYVSCFSVIHLLMSGRKVHMRITEPWLPLAKAITSLQLKRNEKILGEKIPGARFLSLANQHAYCHFIFIRQKMDFSRIWSNCIFSKANVKAFLYLHVLGMIIKCLKIDLLKMSWEIFLTYLKLPNHICEMFWSSNIGNLKSPFFIICWKSIPKHYFKKYLLSE